MRFGSSLPCAVEKMVPESIALTNYLIFGTCMTLIAAGCFGWYLLRNEPRIKLRDPVVNTYWTVGFACAVSVVALRRAVAFPCWLTAFLWVLVTTLALVSATVRGVVGVAQELRDQIAKKANIDNEDLPGGVGSSLTGSSLPHNHEIWQNLKEFLLWGTGIRRPSSDSQFLKSLASVSSKTRSVTMILALGTLPAFFVLGVLVAAVPNYRNGCYACALYYELFIGCMAMVAFILAMVSGFVVEHVKRSDAAGVFMEMKLTLIGVALVLTAWILIAAQVLETDAWEYMALAGVAEIWFVWTPLQLFIAWKQRRDRRVFAKRAQLQELDLIYTDHNVYEEFLEFGSQYYIADSIKFLKAVAQWKAVYFERTPIQRSVRARALHRLYLIPNATLEMNVSHDTRIAITLKLEKSDIDVNMFDDCVQEVASMFKHTTWKDFLRVRAMPKISLRSLLTVSSFQSSVPLN